ncbi:hypothetical protein ACNHYB_06170 [Isoptericola jiangsuensis]|uniref:hypothetical protein n=1 Tax=Isoptericola jiangsuensis TaxID=548579 RepID=UPI003AAD430F
MSARERVAEALWQNGFAVEDAGFYADEWLRGDQRGQHHWLGTPDAHDIEAHALVAVAAVALAGMQHDLALKLLADAQERITSGASRSVAHRVKALRESGEVRCG